MLCKILLIGDSLIFGLGKHSNDEYNAGIVGNNSKQVYERLVPESKKHCPAPTYIVIHTGVNNLYWPPEKQLSYLNKIKASACKLSSKVVFLESPVQWNLTRVKALNLNLKSLESSCAKIMPYPKILTSYLGKDNIHLSFKGYRLWYSNLQVFLKTLDN